ncbi:quinate permease [Fusarium verticillioides 7600]|uniref:Quinate transporter n=1 Tax=Gibberella moniliformis (strain M3125 / FGSC 7600) TaxID=334819 RepID=W7M208_GIBM7|nr:quinate permease [Fusarium verticillioides 7600]EWG45016.1 quinate permease [Fusarium verticillioides 7600]
MGLLTLQEDRPTPKAVYNWRVYTCAAIASMAACTIGYDSAFIGTTLALPSFNIVSVYQAGAFFGSLFAYVSSYFIGRRYSLILFSLVFMVGAGMMLGANGARGLGLIIGGRVLAGIGVGGCSNMTPIYISELAPPAVRGRLVGLYEVGWQAGGLVGFWINYGINQHLPYAPGQNENVWLIPFAVQLIPAGLLLIGAVFIPESPRCAVGAGFWKPFAALKEAKVRWRFLLGALLFVFLEREEHFPGSGINAINYYSPTVFKSIGITGTNTSFLTTGIFGVVKTTITFIWILVLIDHVGRRNLLMIGAGGGAFCMYFIGAYIKIANNEAKVAAGEDPKLSSGGIAAVFFFYLWTAFYTPSWNGTPWVLNSEMFDQTTRSLGQANAAANNWFWNFIIARFTEQMFNAWGWGVYIFFASLMVISVFFVFFCIPETKGVPLEAMDKLFETKPIWRANKIVMEELRLQDEEFRHNVDGADLREEKANAEQIEGKV